MRAMRMNVHELHDRIIKSRESLIISKKDGMGQRVSAKKGFITENQLTEIESHFPDAMDDLCEVDFTVESFIFSVQKYLRPGRIPIDFTSILGQAHQLRARCSRIDTTLLVNMLDDVIKYCNAKNSIGLRVAFRLFQNRYEDFRTEFWEYLMLLDRAATGDFAVPIDNPLIRRIVIMRQSLIDQGILDRDSLSVQELEKKASVVDSYETFIEAGIKMVNRIEDLLKKEDYEEISELLDILWESSDETGGSKIKSAVGVMIAFNDQGCVERLKESFEDLRREFVEFKGKLGPYLQLLREEREEQTSRKSYHPMKFLDFAHRLRAYVWLPSWMKEVKVEPEPKRPKHEPD